MRPVRGSGPGRWRLVNCDRRIPGGSRRPKREPVRVWGDVARKRERWAGAGAPGDAGSEAASGGSDAGRVGSWCRGRWAVGRRPDPDDPAGRGRRIKGWFGAIRGSVALCPQACRRWQAGPGRSGSRGRKINLTPGEAGPGAVGWMLEPDDPAAVGEGSRGGSGRSEDRWHCVRKLADVGGRTRTIRQPGTKDKFDAGRGGSWCGGLEVGPGRSSGRGRRIKGWCPQGRWRPDPDNPRIKRQGSEDHGVVSAGLRTLGAGPRRSGGRGRKMKRQGDPRIGGVVSAALLTLPGRPRGRVSLIRRDRLGT